MFLIASLGIIFTFIFLGIFYQTLSKTFTQENHELRERLFQTILQSQQAQNEALNQGLMRLQESLRIHLHESDHHIKKEFDKLNLHTEERLNKGFEKTNQTFTNIITRLALIDEAQKKLNDLSINIISLQDILNDKRARGAFGEIQLEALIHNVLPKNNYQMQYTLSNGCRVDCMLFLPKPTGKIAIDAKFPLENYRILTDLEQTTLQRTQAKQQFRQDVKKHIQAISEKYILPNETAEGALMFIPAEAVFAEIHGHFPDLVDYAHKARVWMSSPTTLMAILTTAAAVIKDGETQKQVHIIQEHLSYLAQDFSRFDKRMMTLTKHIQQLTQDAEEVNCSARKITTRFAKIEKVDLPETLV